MPRIPTLYAQREIGYSRGLPAPPAYGAEASQALQEQGQIFDRIQTGYNAVEGAKIAGLASEGMRGALAEAKTKYEADPEGYKAYMENEIPRIYDDAIASAPNNAVRQQLEIRLANDRAAAAVQAKYGYAEQQVNRSKADMVVVEDTLSKAIVAEGDPEKRKILFRTYGQAVGATPFGAGEKQKRIVEFNQKVLERQADTVIRGSKPEDFFVRDSAGEFDALPLDRRLKLRESAQKQVEQNDRANERFIAKNRQLAIDGWYVQLQTKDGISQTELEQAKKGEHPFIKSQDAYEFQKKVDDGGAGAGDQQADTIMMQYYLRGEGSQGSAAIARKELGHLIRTLNGPPSKKVLKYLGELQSDVGAAISRGIAQQGAGRAEVNNQVTTFKSEFGAVTPPGIKLPGMPNMDKLQEQKGEALIRKGQKEEADKIIKDRTTKMKDIESKIPDSVKAGRQALEGK